MAAGDGLVTMTPTSIVVAGAGSSASIQSDGSVDFTSATSLSLNGVFTSGFDNYLIVCRFDTATSSSTIESRLRSAGTDATASNYIWQRIFAGSTTVSAARSASVGYMRVASNGTEEQGFNVAVYGPALAQPTAFRSTSVVTADTLRLDDTAGTHSLSTSYDGWTMADNTGYALTGSVVVFGYEE